MAPGLVEIGISLTHQGDLLRGQIDLMLHTFWAKKNNFFNAPRGIHHSPSLPPANPPNPPWLYSYLYIYFVCVCVCEK